MREIASTFATASGIIKPIYAIKGHNVNVKELLIPRKLGKPDWYRVSYKLGWRTEELVTNFLESTDDHRTLIFVNPKDPTKTIGIPIMNIESCVRIK